MFRIRIAAVFCGALFAALLGAGAAFGMVPPAAAATRPAGSAADSMAVPVPTFSVRYFAEGGSLQVYLLAKRGVGVAGEAWLDSEEYDQRHVRSLTVCDPARDGVSVRARVLVPDGRRIDYLAPVGRPCFIRDLGFPIARWQLWVGGAFSGAVPPPQLV